MPSITGNQSRRLTAVVGGAAAFIIPSLFLYQKTGRQLRPETLLPAVALIIVGYLLTRATQLNRRVGVGLVINGVALWGIGWMSMQLLANSVGWWIFTAGWILLSFGLIVIGTADFANAMTPSYAIVLLLGLWPLLVELLHPYHVATLSGPIQLFMMFATVLGWIFFGIGATPPHAETKELALSLNASPSSGS